MKRTIEIDVEVDKPFENAEQERYVLASIEEAMQEDGVWFDLLCDEKVAPQSFSNVRARFTK